VNLVLVATGLGELLFYLKLIIKVLTLSRAKYMFMGHNFLKKFRCNKWERKCFEKNCQY